MVKITKSAWLHVRLTPEQRAAICDLALRHGMTPSEYIRHLADCEQHRDEWRNRIVAKRLTER